METAPRSITRPLSIIVSTGVENGPNIFTRKNLYTVIDSNIIKKLAQIHLNPTGNLKKCIHAKVICRGFPNTY